MRLKIDIDCDMLLYPAAFNMTTGPLHWELLQRARANDLQLFVATISPGENRLVLYTVCSTHYGYDKVTLFSL